MQSYFKVCVCVLVLVCRALITADFLCARCVGYVSLLIYALVPTTENGGIESMAFDVGAQGFNYYLPKRCLFSRYFEGEK